MWFNYSTQILSVFFQGDRLREFRIRPCRSVSAGLWLGGRRQRLGLGPVRLRSQALCCWEQIFRRRAVQAAACGAGLGLVRRNHRSRSAEWALQGAGRGKQQRQCRGGHRGDHRRGRYSGRSRGDPARHFAGETGNIGRSVSKEGDVAV